MKIKRIIGALLLSCCIFFGFATSVSALESTTTEQIQQNETEASKWFDKEMMGYIIEFALAFGGAVIAVGGFVGKFKNLTSAFNKDAKEKEKLAAQITNDKEMIVKSNEETKQAIFEDNAKTRADVEKLIKVFGIAFSNDSKLVKNGAATEIMKVLGEQNENTEA